MLLKIISKNFVFLFILILSFILKTPASAQSNNGTFENYYPYTTVYESAVEPNGTTAWFGSYDAGIFRYDGISWQNWRDFGTWVYFIVIDKNNIKWFGTNRGVVSYNDTSWTSYPFGAVNAAVDQDNNLWFTDMGSGIRKYDGITFQVFNTSNSGLPTNQINDIKVDHENTLWLILRYGGIEGRLCRFDGNNCTIYMPPGNINYHVYDFKIANDDSKLLATGRELVKFDGTNWSYLNQGTVSCLQTTGVPIFSVEEQPDGSLWLGTPRGAVYYNGSTCKQFGTSGGELQDGTNTGVPLSEIYSITRSCNGSVWFTATWNGIAHLTGGQYTVPGVCENLIVQTDGPYNVYEGSDIIVNATASGAQSPVSYAWDLDDNGSFETPGQSVSFLAAQLDGPTSRTIHVKATSLSGSNAEASTNVAVQNANPIVGQIIAPADPVLVNTSINVTANFTDPGIPDTHTAVWDWGDGTSNGTLTESNGSGTVSDIHTYTAPGIYTIQLTIWDDDGGENSSIYQYVSVYNPTPQGLYSGARMFQSPAGAYMQNPNLTGIIKFGVSTKYFNSVADGNVSMNFAAANLDFESTAISSLVISNGKAILHGTGTINGSGNYSFLSTGLDGQPGNPDFVRFQIKDSSNTVVYDSQPGVSDLTDPSASVIGQIIVH